MDVHSTCLFFDVEGSVPTHYKYLYVLVCVSGHRVHSLAYANRVVLGKELFIFLAQNYLYDMY